MKDRHVIEAMGMTKAIIEDGKVVYVGKPAVTYCPLFMKHLGIQEITSDVVRDNVEFRMGEAEDIPAADGSVDWVISNCVINLSPDKPRVFAEIARVLKPGGRFSISDIVVAESLPEDIRSSISAWTGCVAGAISEAEYLEGLRRAGLRDVEVAERVVYDEPTIRSFVGSCCLPGDDAKVGRILAEFGGNVWSARIQGRR